MYRSISASRNEKRIKGLARKCDRLLAAHNQEPDPLTRAIRNACVYAHNMHERSKAKLLDKGRIGRHYSKAQRTATESLLVDAQVGSSPGLRSERSLRALSYGLCIA